MTFKEELDLVDDVFAYYSSIKDNYRKSAIGLSRVPIDGNVDYETSTFYLYAPNVKDLILEHLEAKYKLA